MLVVVNRLCRRHNRRCRVDVFVPALVEVGGAPQSRGGLSASARASARLMLAVAGPSVQEPRATTYLATLAGVVLSFSGSAFAKTTYLRV